MGEGRSEVTLGRAEGEALLHRTVKDGQVMGMDIMCRRGLAGAEEPPVVKFNNKLPYDPAISLLGRYLCRRI